MIVGIDLGTTNSLIGAFTDEGVKLVPNRLNSHLTPSVVALDLDGNVLVGETAKEFGTLHPDRVASVFKRSMGTEKKYTLANMSFLSEELSSFVLKSLKEDAEEYFNEKITEAVISVPAYFDERRRKATKRAGALAGLKVERIISEPTAAAVAYGLYEKDKDTRFLVFDLGGGTFDVSILELFGTILEVRSVAGDNFLGGEDFTEKLKKHFLKKNKLDVESFSEKELVRLRNEAEKVKKQFCENDSVDMKFVKDGKEYVSSINIFEFNEWSEELFERIKQQIQRSLSDAHFVMSEIDEVLLVGGATRLPIVREFITKLLRIFPNTNVNPDEVVAVGAAIQGAMKERREEVREMILTDVCPFTLGTSIVEWDGRKMHGDIFSPIIERNTVIPASRTNTYYPIDDKQKVVKVDIYQGECRLCKDNLLLGEMVIDLPDQSDKKEAVDITFTYDINSLLEVEVKINTTGEIRKQIIKNNAIDMSDDEIQKRMEELSYLKIHPRNQEENKLLLLRGEKLYEQSTGDIRQEIGIAISKFESSLDTRDDRQINDARRVYKQILFRLEKMKEETF